jgi:nitrate reductase NapAB chaperone NapD
MEQIENPKVQFIIVINYLDLQCLEIVNQLKYLLSIDAILNTNLGYSLQMD